MRERKDCRICFSGWCGMERIDKILNHNLFKECLRKNEKAELGREFCLHSMGHFLDVARLAALLNLKEDRRTQEEPIYAAALLHDIGRFRQYADGTPHEKASAEIAPAILEDCGFDEKETDVIINAILRHREEATAKDGGLAGLLYRADRLSRSCFACKAEKKCNWKEKEKNRRLIL